MNISDAIAQLNSLGTQHGFDLELVDDDLDQQVCFEFEPGTEDLDPVIVVLA